MEKLALIARSALRTAALGRREGSLCSPKVFLRRQSCLKNNCFIDFFEAGS